MKFQKASRKSAQQFITTKNTFTEQWATMKKLWFSKEFQDSLKYKTHFSLSFKPEYNSIWINWEMKRLKRLIGTRQVRFLENHWKWSKIDFRKNDFLGPDRSQGYVFDLAEFKKREKKSKNYARFWEIETQKVKICKKKSFWPQKLSAHLSALSKPIFLNSLTLPLLN